MSGDITYRLVLETAPRRPTLTFVAPLLSKGWERRIGEVVYPILNHSGLREQARTLRFKPSLGGTAIQIITFRGTAHDILLDEPSQQQLLQALESQDPPLPSPQLPLNQYRGTRVSASYQFVERAGFSRQPFPRPPARGDESLNRRALRVARHMHGNSPSSPIENKKFRIDFQGARLSARSVHDHKMVLTLNREERRVTTRFARWNPMGAEEGVSSSMLRRDTTTVALFRAVEDDEGTIAYAGRLKNRATAETALKAMILNEWSKVEGRKGLMPIYDEAHQITGYRFRFRFLAQSLLDMTGKEGKMFRDLETVLRDLKYLDVELPGREGMTRIALEPLLSSEHFNATCHLARHAPKMDRLGAAAARHNETADAQLIEWAKEKIGELRRTQGDHGEQSGRYHELALHIHQLEDTIDWLQPENSRSLKSWQRVMCRAFLCRLLNLPILVNCKSSKDRTSVALSLYGALSFVSEEKLNALFDSLGRDGKFAIFELPNHPQYGPLFRELFLAHLSHNLMTPQYGDGGEGYKLAAPAVAHPIGDRLLRTLSPDLLTEALQDCLPASCFEERSVAFKVYAALVTVVASIVALAIWILSCLVLHPISFDPRAFYRTFTAPTLREGEDGLRLIRHRPPLPIDGSRPERPGEAVSLPSRPADLPPEEEEAGEEASPPPSMSSGPDLSFVYSPRPSVAL